MFGLSGSENGVMVLGVIGEWNTLGDVEDKSREGQHLGWRKKKAKALEVK